MSMGYGGSFWNSDMGHHLSSSSPLDDMLEKGNFTLEQLLNQDDVIQECKAMNSILVDQYSFLDFQVININFDFFSLCKPENILSMVKYITESPEEKNDKAAREKFSFVCSELFACELVSMFDALLENQDALEQLFSFVSSKNALNPTLAGHFRKVVGVLIQRKYEEVC